MSINRLFEIGQRSLQAANAKMEAASQNIANAESEGYHRRRATLRPSSTVSQGIYTTPAGNTATGDGVSVSSYERVRDRMLESSAAEAKTGESGAREEARVLTQLEGALATDTEGSLPATLEKFWDGWNKVASNADDQGVRSALLSRADTLTSAFHRIDQRVSELTGDTKTELASSVEEVNEKLDEIASLNKKIREARASGARDLAAEDRRDAVVKKLSEFVPVEVQEGKQDGYTVTVDGMSVVQGGESTHLKLASPTSVEFGDTGVALEPGSEGRGKVGAQLRMLNQTLPDVQNRLDGLAKDVVEKVNNVHESGYDQNGNTNVSFFDPAGTTAGSIQRAVSAPEEIAAYGGANATGDTQPAQDIAALSDDLTPEAVDLYAHVGAEIRKASAQEESKAAMADHLKSVAEGVSGVSLDEEMSNLIKHQQAFAASARVLRTAQQVTDTLLSM